METPVRDIIDIFFNVTVSQYQVNPIVNVQLIY